MIHWQAPGPYTVAFSTRQGGVSDGVFASLNLTHGPTWWKEPDPPANVERNRVLFCEGVGADPTQLTLNVQRHSPAVHRAEAGKRGVIGDGLWTDEPDVPMLALTADCVPIAIARTNGDKPALAIVHAGWRGLLEDVVAAAVTQIGSRAAAVIGPAIGPCCYEVGPDVAEPFGKRFGRDVLRGGNLDLWTSTERTLRDAGIASVERLDICTACNPGLLFSHRRDGTPRGAQGVLGFIA
jgi:purine-nucleoside/S-methyl-5'-thioadenosine phosphorylase / adenosine deaminase